MTEFNRDGVRKRLFLEREESNNPKKNKSWMPYIDLVKEGITSFLFIVLKHQNNVVLNNIVECHFDNIKMTLYPELNLYLTSTK